MEKSTSIDLSAYKLNVKGWKEQCKQITPVQEARPTKSWLDFLPSACALPQAFKTGTSLDELLDIIGKTETELDKKCKKCCHCTVAECHKRWQAATQSQILGKQIDKALAGSDSMLTWYGKAVLRQQEPANDEEQVVPTQINILGLNANQEQELETLRAQIKALKAGDNNTVIEEASVVDVG